eukprot:COSAG06_NODE_6581_length_2870_cov_4.019488_2_plen_273_part_00
MCCDDWCVRQPEPIVLWNAAWAGKLDKVKAAVDAGAQMEWANPGANGERAVHAASEKGHKDVVAFLGSRGADVNAVDDNRQSTPLHYAARKASVCTTLLALGADPAAKDKDGKTALDLARKMNKSECVAVLEAAIAEAMALLRRDKLKLPRTATDAECEQAEEAAWKASGGPEALAAVAAAVASGDRTKVATAQKALEEVARVAGTTVSAFNFFLRALEATKQAGIPVHFAFRFKKLHSCCRFSPASSSRRNALHTLVACLHTGSSAKLCPE